MADQEPAVVGIDLGTTYSCIARLEAGRPVVIPNAEGPNTTPSVVFFDGGNRIVGEEAKNNAHLYPDQVIAMVKRQMGQSDWRFSYEGVDYSPEEISSYILRKVVSDAEQQLGLPIRDAVITCPAYFGLAEKEATKRAGEIAGLNVLSIIPEPTAAAIAYGMLEGSDQVVLVYDLGGGTFDITMIAIKGGAIDVIATGGNHHLGGRQWDEVIVNYLAEQWKAETGSIEDPMDSSETLQDLFAKAEKGKWALTQRGHTDIPVFHDGQRVGVRLTREKFDELTGQLLEQTIEYTRSMLKLAAEKGYSRFDDFLLVGGSTRMPQVKARVEAEFKVEAKIFDPDQSVAKGAALYAYKLKLDPSLSLEPSADPVVQEQRIEEAAANAGIPLATFKAITGITVSIVSSRSFGVIAWQRVNGREVELVTNLIKVNTRLPAQASQTFGTYDANQPQADIRFVEDLLQDETVEPGVCEEIGTATLLLPPRLPAGSPIEITFHLNEQGLLHATAREMTTNRVVEVEIRTERAISDEELAEAKVRASRIAVV